MKPILAVDIDEVLAAFVSKLADFHNDCFGSSLTQESFHSYEFHHVFGGDVESCSAKVKQFFNSDYVKTINPLPGSFDALQVLSRDFELHIITARQTHVQDLTKAWIHTYFPNTFHDIHFGNHYSYDGSSRSKAEICLSINALLLVDDSLKYAKDCAAHGIPVILFGNYPWNRPDVESDLEYQRYMQGKDWYIKQAHHWDAVVELVYQRIKTSVKIAAIQLCSSSNIDSNLKTIEGLVQEAVEVGKAKFICLPECCCFVGENMTDIFNVAQTLLPLENNVFLSFFSNLAKRFSVILSIGGFPELVVANEKISNCHVLLGCDGAILYPVYRKIHLFDNPLTGLCESKTTVPGNDVVVVSSDLANIGLTICYDLRFPELFIKLCKGCENDLGAEIVLIPSAFTMVTGKAHWEVLLRARAIENQVYIVAAAQSGKHNENRESWGHTMIIDPWGSIVGECKNVGSGICYGDFDRRQLREVREKIPVWSHRRPDCYA